MSSQVKRLIINTLRAIEQETVSPDARTSVPKSRQGKKLVSGHFDPAVAWQLKKLALDRHATVQSLLEESLNDLFDKYHLPRL